HNRIFGPHHRLWVKLTCCETSRPGSTACGVVTRCPALRPTRPPLRRTGGKHAQGCPLPPRDRRPREQAVSLACRKRGCHAFAAFCPEVKSFEAGRESMTKADE